MPEQMAAAGSAVCDKCCCRTTRRCEGPGKPTPLLQSMMSWNQEHLLQCAGVARCAWLVLARASFCIIARTRASRKEGRQSSTRPRGQTSARVDGLQYRRLCLRESFARVAASKHAASFPSLSPASLWRDVVLLTACFATLQRIKT